jgi:hypothetical protein
MRRTIPLSLLVLMLLGSVATADRYRDGRGSHVQRHDSRPSYRQAQPHRVQPSQRYVQRHDSRPSYRQAQPHRVQPSQRYVQPRQRYVQPRHYVQPRGVYRAPMSVVRRPIYVQRPVIQYRYFNYAQRPAIIAESYPPMTGYIWVAGQWQWNGYEWIWQPGHYQPDPAYDAYGYPYAPYGY